MAGILDDISGLIGQGAITGANYAGNKAAAADQVAGYQTGINTLGGVQGQNATALGNTANTNAGVLSPAAATGAGASGNLATYLGLNGKPADFSQFYNTPGYQFALQQGTRAINSQAAAAGSAFTPNTLAAVGNYVQGAASTNYNNYINQLLQAQGQGITAQQGIVNSNTGLAEAGVNSNLSTGSSIAQLQGAQGSANASGMLNQTGIIGNGLSALGGASGIGGLISSLLGGSGNSTGTAGGANSSGLSSILSALGHGVNNLFSGFSGTGTPGTMNGQQLENLTGDLSPTVPAQPDPQASMSNDQLAQLYGFAPSDTSGGSTDQFGSDGYDPSSFFSAGGQAATLPAGTNPVDVSGYISGLQTPDSVNLGPTVGTPSTPTFGSNVGGALGILGGATSGTAVGQAQAGLSAAQLAARNNLLGANGSAIGNGATSAMQALGLYAGLKAGGVAGDTQAAVSAAQLATRAGVATGALSGASGAAFTSALGYAAIPLALYNEAKSWQSGNTGGDAMQGASTGAAIGTAIVPGIGTAVGAVIGAAVGALSSIAGGGKQDPETATGQNIDAALANGSATLSSTGLTQDTGAFQYLAGIMDAKNNSPGHSTQMEQVFGRQGEGAVLNGMATTINSAVQDGTIKMLPGGGVSFKTGGGTVNYPASQASQAIYSGVIAPWLSSKGAAVDMNGVDVKGNNIGTPAAAALQTLIGSYINGTLTPSSAIGISGQADTSLPSFAGLLND